MGFRRYTKQELAAIKDAVERYKAARPDWRSLAMHYDSPRFLKDAMKLMPDRNLEFVRNVFNRMLGSSKKSRRDSRGYSPAEEAHFQRCAVRYLAGEDGWKIVEELRASFPKRTKLALRGKLQVTAEEMRYNKTKAKAAVAKTSAPRPANPAGFYANALRARMAEAGVPEDKIAYILTGRSAQFTAEQVKEIEAELGKRGRMWVLLEKTAKQGILWTAKKDPALENGRGEHIEAPLRDEEFPAAIETLASA